MIFPSGNRSKFVKHR